MKYLITATMLLCAPLGARAEIIISVENISVPYSTTDQTGSFELYVQSTEATPPSIIGQQVRLHLSPLPAGFAITGVGAPLAHPYIFGSSVPVGTAAPEPGGLKIDEGDFLLLGSGTLNNGVGLAKVDFKVAGSTPMSTINVAVDINPNSTMLVDTSYAALPFGAQNGQISIVPEPSSLMLLVTPFVALGICAWRRGWLCRGRNHNHQFGHRLVLYAPWRTPMSSATNPRGVMEKAIQAAKEGCIEVAENQRIASQTGLENSHHDGGTFE